jgi:hypothetical protein
MKDKKFLMVVEVRIQSIREEVKDIRSAMLDIAEEERAVYEYPVAYFWEG